MTSVFQPTVYNQMFFTEPQRRRRTDLDIAAGYVQDQIAITRYVDILAGVRFDSFNLKFQSDLDEDGRYAPGATRFRRIDNVWSPRFGLVMKPRENVSFYGAYSRTFLPAAGDQFTNLEGELVRGDVDPQTLAPQKFENFEIGFKAELSPRLLFTGALYQLDRSNHVLEYQEDFNLVTSTRTRGGEIGLVGNPADEWFVSLAYGRQHSAIASADESFAVGKRTPSVPRDTFSMWNRYDLSSFVDATPGTFGVGAGVVHNSSVFASPDNAVHLPGYTRLDGAIYVKLTENITGQLNIENIGGVRYYAAHRNNLITPGAPRFALFTLNAKF
jgi:catecholate siderophore receptor